MNKLSFYIALLLSGAGFIHGYGEGTAGIKIQANSAQIKQLNKQKTEIEQIINDFNSNSTSSGSTTWKGQLLHIETEGAAVDTGLNTLSTELLADGVTTTAISTTAANIQTELNFRKTTAGDISTAATDTATALNDRKNEVQGTANNITNTLVPKLQAATAILQKTTALTKTQEEAFSKLLKGIARVMSARQSLQLSFAFHPTLMSKTVANATALALNTPELPKAHAITVNHGGTDHKNKVQNRLDNRGKTLGNAVNAVNEVVTKLNSGTTAAFNASAADTTANVLKVDLDALKLKCMADATAASRCDVDADLRALLATLQDAYGEFHHIEEKVSALGLTLDSANKAIITAVEDAIKVTKELLQDEAWTLKTVDFKTALYFPESHYVDGGKTLTDNYQTYLTTADAVLKGHQLAVEEAFRRYVEAISEEINSATCTGVDATLGFVPNHARLLNLLAVIYDTCLKLVIAELTVIDLLAIDCAHRDFKDRGDTYATHAEAMARNMTSVVFTAFKDDAEKKNGNWSTFATDPLTGAILDYAREGLSRFTTILGKLTGKSRLATTYRYP